VTAESAEDAAVGAATTPESVAAARAAVIAEEEADEPTIPGGEVQVLTEENFERLTQVATGATTGDWFIGEFSGSPPLACGYYDFHLHPAFDGFRAIL